MVFIIVIMIVVSKFSEIWVLEFLQKISIHMDQSRKEKQARSLAIYFVVTAISTLIFDMTGYIFVKPIQRAYRSASKEFFRQYLSYDYVEFTKIGSGEIHSTIERKSKAVSDIIEVTVLDILPILVTFIFVMVQVCNKISKFSGLIMGISFILYCYVTVVIARKRMILRKEVNSHINIQSNVLYDSLQNFESILAYCNRELEIKRYDRKLSDTGVYYIKLYRALYVLNFLQKFILLLQMYFIILSGINGFFMQSLDNGTFMVYINLFKLMSSSVNKAGYLYSKFITAIVNSVGELSIRTKHTGTLDFHFDKEISVSNLCIFHGEKIILTNINFTISKGEKIAIVGRNGVGKSSLIKVLLGFADYSGDVLIDNINMKSINLDKIRAKIGYIHQDSALFNDTVLYNIFYGNIDSNQEAIVDVCKQIGVHDSIVRLNNSYKTVVGERGMFLSGGEKQKVAFARAALKNADILLLDEPTASLDKEAEMELIDKLLTYYEDKTLFMIVHNLSLLQKFDKILFINDSTCKETGSHDDLMALEGSYYTFIMEATQINS